MRKLLLLLPLILVTPVLAQSDRFKLGEYALAKYQLHFDNAFRLIMANDMELGCSELREAATVLKTNFSLLQQHAPEYDWFKHRATHRQYFEGSCK